MASTKASFTFLELIIVMAIIGALCAVAFPSVSRQFSLIQLDSFSRRLLALCVYSSGRSRAEHSTLELAVDSEKRQVVLIRYAGQANEYKRFPIPAGITCRIRENRAFFYPDGSHEKFSLDLADERGHRTGIDAKSRYGGFHVTETQ